MFGARQGTSISFVIVILFFRKNKTSGNFFAFAKKNLQKKRDVTFFHIYRDPFKRYVTFKRFPISNNKEFKCEIETFVLYTFRQLEY